MTGFERITWFYEKLKKNTYPRRRKFLAHFEVSESTFKRDLAFLRDRLGAPVDYDQDRHGYFLTDRSFELPSFWFDHRQLLIIAAVCRQLEQLTSSPAMTVLRNRLLDMLTLRGGRRLDIFSFENAACVSCDNANFDTLSKAMLMEHPISITYQDGKNGALTNREVEPYRLHNYDGSWYVIGFCRLRQAPRNFQLGRILDLVVLDEVISSPQFDVEDYLSRAFGIFKGRDVVKVVLRFSQAIAHLINEQRWHPEQVLNEEADGSLLLSFPVADFTEIRMKTMQYGGQVEVVSPEELRRQVAMEAAKICDIYDRDKR